MSGSPREEGGQPLAASQTDNSAATATGDTPEDQVSVYGLFSLFIHLSALALSFFSSSSYNLFLSAVNH